MPRDAQQTIGPMDGYLDDFPGERNYMRINHPGLFTAEDGEVVEENRPHSKRDFVAALDEEERPNDVQPNQQPLPTSVAQFGQHRERPAPHSPLTPTRGVSPLPSQSPKRVLSPPPTAQDGRQPQSPRRSATPPTVPRPAPMPFLRNMDEQVPTERLSAMGLDGVASARELKTENARLEAENRKLKEELARLRGQGGPAVPPASSAAPRSRAAPSSAVVRALELALEAEKKRLSGVEAELRALKAKLHRVAEEHPM